jgi:hypothetical protein
MEVPGTSELNTAGDAQATSVSCTSAGNCSAGGYLEVSRNHWQPFAVSQRNGTWHRAFLPVTR